MIKVKLVNVNEACEGYTKLFITNQAPIGIAWCGRMFYLTHQRESDTGAIIYHERSTYNFSGSLDQDHRGRNVLLLDSGGFHFGTVFVEGPPYPTHILYNDKVYGVTKKEAGQYVNTYQEMPTLRVAKLDTIHEKPLT